MEYTASTNGVAAKRFPDCYEHGAVQAVGVGHLEDRELRRQLAQRGPEADLPLLVPAEAGAAQGEHAAGRLPSPLGDQVGGGGTGRVTKVTTDTCSG